MAFRKTYNRRPNKTAVVNAPIERILPPTNIVGSPQQEAVWEALKSTRTNIIVEARAGTGKTFTIVHGLHKLTQDEQMNACFVAFNKSIALELQKRVPQGVRASTMHSLGLQVLRNAYGRCNVDGWKVGNIIQDLYGSKPPYATRLAVEKLVGFCKSNLEDGTDTQILEDLLIMHDIQVSGKAEVFQLVPMVLKRCKELTDVIDYDDMIWLPVVNKVPMRKYGLLMVDEAQDLNRSQQELALMAGDRICLVGDRYQSIYGFRGADTQSLPRMEDYLSKTDRGVAVYPLTVSRRCPVVGIALAKRLVDDIECLPDAPVGDVETISTQSFAGLIKPGDMALCRVNAPLLSAAYQLIRNDVKAVMQGRDIGKGMVELIKKCTQAMQAENVSQMLVGLDQYQMMEEERIMKAIRYSDARLTTLRDRCDCVRAISEGIEDLDDLHKRIEALFSDVEPNGEPKHAVLLSSIHRAKGLEANNVFVLEPRLIPHPMAKQDWDKEQERNIAYVLVTRFISKLVWVGDAPQLFAGTPNVTKEAYHEKATEENRTTAGQVGRQDATAGEMPGVREKVSSRASQSVRKAPGRAQRTTKKAPARPATKKSPASSPKAGGAKKGKR